jgi:hypothetical protein
MALQVSSVEVWAGDLRDQPGGLAQVLEALGAAGVDLECVIARRDPSRPGVGEVFLTPLKGRAQQDAARAAGLLPAAELATLRVEGANRPGLGGRITRAVAAAGVNMRGVSAAVVGNRFVTYVGFDSDADAAAAARAIKAVEANKTSGGRAATTGRAGAASARRGGARTRRRPAAKR